MNIRYMLTSLSHMVSFSSLLIFTALSQSTRVDSLQRVVAIERIDSSKINALVELCVEYRKIDVNKALDYARQAVALSETQKDYRFKARSYVILGSMQCALQNNKDARANLLRGLKFAEGVSEGVTIIRALRMLGMVEQNLGKMVEALSLYEKALKVAMQTGDRTGIGNTLDNLARVNYDQGKYTRSMEYHLRSLKIREELGDKGGIAGSLNGLALIYLHQGALSKAKEYFQRSLNMFEELGDKSSIVPLLNNIAFIYREQGDYSLALSHLQRSLKLNEELGDKASIAGILSHMAVIFHEQGNDAMSMEYHQRNMKLREQLRDRSGIIGSMINIAHMHAEKGNYDSAISICERAYSLSKETGSLSELKVALNNLNDWFAQKGDFTKAYAYHVEYVAIKDSLLNETNIKSINEMTAKYESEKKEQQIALLEKDKSIRELELIKNKEQLRAQKLQTENVKKNALLLANENELRFLELNNRTANLELRTKTLELQKTAKEKEGREKHYQASMFSLQRNALLVAIGLLLVVGFLGVKRVQAKRMEATLRAEAAEYQAQAAKALANTLRMEQERKEAALKHDYMKSLITSQESERKRIARELHDSIGQEAMVIKSNLHIALEDARVPEDLCHRLMKATNIAATMLDDIRLIAYNLRPLQLERVGLSETIRETSEEVFHGMNVHMQLDVADIDGLLEKDKEIHVFRIVQEGISNILRHANANACSLRIDHDARSIHLTLQDDGTGFAVSSLPRRGLGIQGILERTEILGGNCQIDSAPSNGTIIRIEIPIKA